MPKNKTGYIIYMNLDSSNLDFRSEEIRGIIRQALREDIGNGDHTSLAAFPAGTKGKAILWFKEKGIVAGTELACVILEEVDPELQVKVLVKDGSKVLPGERGMEISGNAHSILKAERLLLNFMQRLSGIATLTHQMAEKLQGTGARLLDTRKTTPLLRKFEKWAVWVGGGHNHRFGLFDMILLKDNHVDYAGGVRAAIRSTRKYLEKTGLELKVEIETRNLEEVREVLDEGGVDRIMLDNFSPELLKQAVDLIDGRFETEASGGITMESIRQYAETGVDFISSGAMTHSYKSLDISLKVQLEAL